MKLLYVGSFIPESTNVAQSNGFELDDCDVIRYDYRKKAVELDGQLTHCNPKRDDDLIKFCNDLQPDVVFFSKCNAMDIRVIHMCNSIGTITVLWYPDNKFNVDGELLDKMRYCRYVFCSRYDGIRAAHSVRDTNVYRIYDGFDAKVHAPIDTEKLYTATFIGNINREGRTIFRDCSNIITITGVYNEAHAKIVGQSKINLNFTEGDGVSDRIYKLLAAQGFVLTQPWENMEDDWSIGKDFDIFNTPEELNSKITYYLFHPELRSEIAKHGHKTALNYDNVHFAKRVLNIIN